jgi:L-alanine-DL-glutamate epimerase-like enolase superfamily enzyme
MDSILIEQVSCINLSSPYGNGNIFGQPSGYKTVSVIEVVSDGTKGYGEAYPGVYAPELVKNYVDFIAKELVGLPVSDLEPFDKVTNKHCISMSGIARSIIGSIEIAIFDICAKKKGISLCQYLAGQYSQDNDFLKCYYSGGSVVLSPRQIKEDVEQSISLGHDAFKMRVGYQDNDINRIEAAREALGSKLLMCDAIQSTLHSWDMYESVNNLREMSKFNLFWAEEFVDPSNVNNVSMLKDNSNVDLAFGESFTTINEFDSLCHRGCLDVAQPDVTQCGGIRAAMGICHHVKNCAKRIAFHIWGGPVAIAANLQLAAALENTLDVWVEIPSVEFKITKDLLKLEIRNGHVAVPSASPGIGVEINDGIKEKYKFSK